MRHRVAHRKLGRVTEHRLSMLRNQATALIRHEHLTTTVPKAKELRPFVEHLITIAKRGVADGGNGKALHARRLLMHDLQDQAVIGKLFDTLAPRFASRPGGYTRLLRIGFRRGDSAEVAQIEFIGSEFNPRAKAESEAQGETAKPKAKGVGGRLRAAAERLRGSRKDADAPAGDSAAAVDAQAAKRAAGRRSSASRKMGGSSKGK